MMARLRTSGALVLLVGLLSALGCRHSASGTEAEHGADLVVLVHTASVERQTVRELVETAGTVGPSLGAEAQVAAQVTGTVVNVLKDEGEEVAASEAVLEIDASVLREEAREAEAEVGRAQADEELNRKKLARAKSLFARGIVAAKEAAEAEAGHTEAAQTLARARATLRVARLQEDRSVVRSPVQGTLLHRLVSPGQYVQPETVLFTVAPMLASLRLPAALSLRPNITLSATVIHGKSAGSWNTSPRSGPGRAMRTPSIASSPEEIGTSPPTM